MATLTQDPPADRYKNISQIQIPKQVQNVLKQRGVDITAMQNDINARIGKGGEEKAKAIEGTFGVFDEILGGYQYRDILDRELKFSTINEAQQAASQAPDVSQIAVPATSPEQTPKPANDRIIGATTAAAIYNSMVDGQKGFFQLIASSIGSAVTDQEKVKAVNDAIGSFYNTKKFDLSDTPAPVYWDTEKDELNVDNVMNVRAWEAIFGQGIGSMLPQILLTYGTQAVVTALGTGATGGLGAGGAAVAGKVAGKAVGAITGLEKKTKNIIRAGSFVMSASQMYPGYLEEATAAGLPYADAQIIAGSTAMANAGLEMWGLERIMKVFGTNDTGARTIMRGVLDQSAKTVIKSMAGKKISNEMFLEAIKEGAKKSINILTKGGRSATIKAAVETGKRVAKNAGPEFGEEFLQEWVGYGAQRIYNGYVADKGATPGQGKYDTNVMSTLVNSGLGATTGGILGGSMTLFQASPRIYDQTAYAMTLADVKNQIDNGATNLDEIKRSGKLFGAIEGWRQSGAFNGQQGFNQQEYDEVVSNADLMYDTAWAFKDYDGFSGSDSEAMFRVAQTKQNMRNKMAAIEESKQTVAQIDEEIANAPDSATEAKLRMEKVKVEKTLGFLDPETNIYEAESIQTSGQAEVNNLTGTFTTAMATPENRPLARQFLESGLSAIDDKYAPSTENRSDFAPNFVDRLSDGSVVTYDTKMGIRFVRETPVEGVTVLDQLGKKSYKPPIRVQVSTEPIVDFNQFQEAASLPYASAPLSIREGIDGLSDSNEVLDFARNEVLSGEPAPESIDQAFDLYNRISNSRAGKDSGVQPMTRDEFDVAIGLQQEIKTKDVAPTAEEDSPITEDQVDTTQDDEILAFQERTGRGFNLNDEYKVSELTMDAINEIEAGSTSVPLLRINTAITELAKERKRWSNMRQASGRQYTTDQINEMLKAIDSDLERLTNEKAYQEEPETRPIVIPEETTTEVQETNGETIEDTDTESTESSRQIAPDIQSEYASEGELAPLAASIDESTMALRESIEQIEESPEVDEEAGGIDRLIGEIDSILSEVGRRREQREAEFTQISNGYDPEIGYDADGPVDVEALLVEDSADAESPTPERGATVPVTNRQGVIDWGPAPGPNLVAKRVPGERVSDREGYKMIPVPGSKKGEYQYAPIWTPDRFIDPADDVETEGAVVNDGVDDDEEIGGEGPNTRFQQESSVTPTTPDKVRSVLNALAQAFPNIAVNIPNTLQEYVDRINNITGAKELYRANETAPYGYLDPSNGQIYLNPDTLNTNTPIHEYGHIWAVWAANNDPELYARGRELALNSPYYRTVANDPRYSNLTQEEMIQEAMAMAIGDKGAKYVTRARRNKLMQWLSDIFDKVKQYLGFTGSTSALENMTFEQFAQMAAEQLLSGDQISGITSEDAASLFSPADQTADDFAEEAEGAGPRIRTMLPPAQPLGTAPGGAGFQMKTATEWKTEAERLLGSILTTKRKDFSKSDKSIIQQVKNTTGWEYLGSGNWKNHLGDDGIHMLYTNTDEIVYMPYGGGVRSKIAEAIEEGLRPLVRDKDKFLGSTAASGLRAMIANAVNLDSFVSMVDNESGILRHLITGTKNHGRRLRSFARGQLKPTEEQWKKEMAKFSRSGSNDATIENVSMEAYVWDSRVGRADKKTIYVPLSVAMNLVRTHNSQMSMGDTYLTVGGMTHSSFVIDDSYFDAFGNINDPSARDIFMSQNDTPKGARIIGGAKEMNSEGSLVDVKDVSGNEINNITVLLSSKEMNRVIDVVENGTGTKDPDRVKKAYALGTKFFNNQKVAELMKKENDEILNPDRPFTPVSFYAPVRMVKDVSADAAVNSFSPTLDDAKLLHYRTRRPEAVYIGDDLDAGNYYLKGVESVLGQGRLVHNLKQIRDAISGESYQGGPHQADLVKFLDKAIADFQDTKAQQAKEMNSGWFMRMANYLTQKNTAFIFRGNLGIGVIQTGTWASAYGQGIIESKYLNRAMPNMFKLAAGGIMDTFGGAGATVIEGTEKGKRTWWGSDTVEREQLEWLTGDHIVDPIKRQEHRDLFATLIDRALYGNSKYTEGLDFTKTTFDRDVSGKLGQSLSAWDQWWEENGMSHIRRIDRSVLLGFVHAAKLKVADEVSAGRLEAENADAKIASLAESLMYATNQMNEITDMTGIQRNWNPIYKAITIYTGQTQKLFNQMAQNFFEYYKWKDKVSDDKRIQLRNRLARSMFNNLIMNTFVVAVVRSLYSALRAVVRGDEPEDEDFYAKKVGFDTLRMVAGMFPGLPEQISGYILSRIDNERWEEGLFEIPGARAGEETIDLPVNLYKYLTASDEKAKDRYRGSLISGANKLFMLWTGTPKIVSDVSSRLLVPPKDKSGRRLPSEVSSEEIDEIMESEELPEEIEEVLE